jgi:hypothetical protein
LFQSTSQALFWTASLVTFDLFVDGGGGFAGGVLDEDVVACGTGKSHAFSGSKSSFTGFGAAIG